MAQQTIGVGSVANDGTGDTIRAAGGKINANFTELYNAKIARTGTVTFTGNFTFSGAVTANTSITFPTTGTLSTLAGAESLTNKTVGTGTVVTLGSDATGDLWYRAATTGLLTRLAIGTTGQVLTVAAGLPSWAASAGGSGSVDEAANYVWTGDHDFTGGTVELPTITTLTVGSATVTSMKPATDDGAPLGDTTHNFSDLFLATGAVINYQAGNVVITHTSGILTMGTGDFRVTTAGTNSASVATVGGTQTLTNKTLTSPAISGATLSGVTVLPTNGQVSLTAPTTDGHATGPTTSSFNSGYSSSAVGDLVYLDSSATWQKTDANTVYDGLLGIALAVAASGAPLLVALPGAFVYATAFPTFTVGGRVYMSETAGAVTQTAPTTTDAASRCIGFAIHADKLFFNPSPDYTTHT